MSMTEIDEIGKEDTGCFQTTSRRLLKRKHSDVDKNKQKTVEKKSFLAAIGERFGLTRPSQKSSKSIVTTNGCRNAGEIGNDSHMHGFLCDVTNMGMEGADENEFPPRKRVKFDEENLIVSSITYQRQQSEANRIKMQPTVDNEKSFITKFINFTASLF